MIVAGEAFDVSREPAYIRKAYGDHVQGRQLLIARRLIERGVRFVQCFHGDVQPWDAHNDVEKNPCELARQCDGPIAAVVTDLKQRGLFRETLAICGGEFGRTPRRGTGQRQTGSRPRPQPLGFFDLAGRGGVRGGDVHGATDDFGFRAVENRVHVHDLHATLLHLLEFDHARLAYRHAGQPSG